tara:strand:+ start:1003 stop:1317 length:315 start_codon:yes stop_codon:yes gene_type:complete
MSKGGKRDNAGRPKGTPNKITADNREVFNTLLQNNAKNMQGMFDRIAEDNPAKAMELLLKVSEYVIPKLRSVEIKQDAGFINSIQIEIIDTSIALASSESEIVN